MAVRASVKLSTQRKAFCRHYVQLDGDLIRSPKAAGYKLRDDDAAIAKSFELLKNEAVLNRIDELSQTNPEPEPLSEMQKQFCEQWIICNGNGTDAALKAGYSQNRNSARTIASRMLAKANIQARIQSLRKDALERADITIEKVLRNHWLMATVDPIEFWDHQKNCLKPFDQIPPEVRCLLEGITYTDGPKGTHISVKLPSRRGANRDLMEYLGLFNQFDQSISALRKHGLFITPKPEGGYSIEDTYLNEDGDRGDDNGDDD